MTNVQKKNERRVNAEKKAIDAIINNYKGLAGSLANQLTLETPNHHLTTGSFREEVWYSLFLQIVPRKFHIEQGIFIIDSNGHISDEVDLAIFDQSYTPYIFKFGKIKFIPIEAVAVAVQCKSKDISGAKDWVKSITELKTSLESVTRVISGLSHNNIKNALPEAGSPIKSMSQTSTRPIFILCSLVEAGNPADPKTKKKQNATCFDIVLNIDKNKRLSKVIVKEGMDYSDWYKELNHFRLDRYNEESENYKRIAQSQPPLQKTMKDLEIGANDDNVILSLTLQLNQLLMLINNPIFFPHQSYAEMFRKHLNHTDMDHLNGHSESGGVL
ncbi:DUF6602 domain-containing protein [Paenibacillus sp. GCM10027627]|uniref:DUF6602 domain-containing protein n=1 Tax=unclassified Paenibacillus TaxID=185978 RepID=UPI0036384653